MLAVEPFAKASRNFENSVLVANNLCVKLVSSLASLITIDGRFIVTWVPILIPDFNLLGCELESFIMKVLYWVILCWYYIKQNEIYNITVSCKKSTVVSFASSAIRSIVVFPELFRLPVKLIRCIVFESASITCYLHKYIAIN